MIWKTVLTIFVLCLPFNAIAEEAEEESPIYTFPGEVSQRVELLNNEGIIELRFISRIPPERQRKAWGRAGALFKEAANMGNSYPSPAIHFNYGLALHKLGKKNEAKSAFQTAQKWENEICNVRKITNQCRESILQSKLLKSYLDKQ